MANTAIIKTMKETFKGTKVEKVADCFLNAKGRFIRVVMKPQESDVKRNGKVRVFFVNVASTWKNYEKKHLGGDGLLTEVGKKILRTKFEKGQLSIIDSIRDEKSGRFVPSPRTIDLNKVDYIKYAGNTYRF